jgi:DNA invertase Pin-like site-specific DNA recombinase
VKIREATDAVLYLRVSTEEQARDAYGLDSQERVPSILHGTPVERA